MLQERAKELHRKACDLSQSSVTRVARPSRRSPAQKSTPGATPPDSSSKSLTPSASVVESLVRPEARAGWPRRTRERAESASTAMWSSKGAAADEAPVMQGQEALQPWEVSRQAGRQPGSEQRAVGSQEKADTWLRVPSLGIEKGAPG